MEPNRISLQEKNRLTDEAAHLFVSKHHDTYFPSAVNSQRIMDWIVSQIGMPVEDYAYPILLEHFETAFFYLQSQHMLFPRPEEVEEVDEAAEEEARKQQKVRDDYAARVEAERIARAKTIPIEQLGAEVSQQNVRFREQRKRNELPTRTLRLESRPLMGTKFPVSQEAQARANTALAHPEIKDRNSAEFMRFYAEELQTLRQQ